MIYSTTAYENDTEARAGGLRTGDAYPTNSRSASYPAVVVVQATEEDPE